MELVRLIIWHCRQKMVFSQLSKADLTHLGAVQSFFKRLWQCCWWDCTNFKKSLLKSFSPLLAVSMKLTGVWFKRIWIHLFPESSPGAAACCSGKVVGGRSEATGGIRSLRQWREAWRGVQWREAAGGGESEASPCGAAPFWSQCEAPNIPCYFWRETSGL